MEKQTEIKINQWLNEGFDADTKKQIENLQKNNIKELEDCFYTDLEFGTGGIRGLMGVGTNRMNKYTIAFSTQGFANYLKKVYSKQERIKIAIAFDSRNNSQFFAQTTADIFSANGFTVFLFEQLRPTPELSFAIRHLQCQAGVVITASHNPKEYNGYKVYWNDGAQTVEPHDKLIIDEINQIKNINQVLWNANTNLIKKISIDVDNAYCDMVADQLCVNKNIIKKQSNIKIVFTSIHGTGITLAPILLKKIGFQNVHIVNEQAEPNGNFPTVIYPNPEEKDAMQKALNDAQKIDADILIGTDPDADRIGIGIKNQHNEWLLLNGNQTALLIFNYCIENIQQKENIQNTFIAKTIVTTDLIDIIAQQNKINCYNVLTGFKWIASLILEKQGKEKFIVGGEEFYGLLVGDSVRDKDAISATAIACEMMAVYKEQNLSLFQALINIYKKYGFYYEELLSVTKKGMDGKKEIQQLMTHFRNNIPHSIAGIKVKKYMDYNTQQETNCETNQSQLISLPKSNVLQILLEDNSKISFRPSGTEPKIKYYFSVNVKVENNFSANRYQDYVNKAKAKIETIIKELKLRE